MEEFKLVSVGSLFVRKCFLLFPAIIILFATSGCSYVPDWANPVTMYDQVFTDDKFDTAFNNEDDSNRLILPPKFPSVADVPRSIPGANASDPPNLLIAERGNSVNEDVVQKQPADADVPLIARPNIPSFKGGPQVNPLLNRGPTPIIPLINKPEVEVVNKENDDNERISRDTQELDASVQKNPPVENFANNRITHVVEVPFERAPDQKILSQIFSAMLAESEAVSSTRLVGIVPEGNGIPAFTLENESVVDQEALAVIQRAISGRSDFNHQENLNFGAVIRFTHGSSLLDDAELNKIREIAQQFQQTGGQIRIVGHASSRTKDMSISNHLMANFKISIDRAKIVADEFMKFGIPPSSLIIIGMGDFQPVLNEAMPAGEAENRRVEIFLET